VYLSHGTGYAFSIPVASRGVSFTDKLPKHPTGSGRKPQGFNLGLELLQGPVAAQVAIETRSGHRRREPGIVRVIHA